MGLNGEKMLQNLKRLSQVDKMKQVEPLSYALFPGYHCPQMSVPITQRWQHLEMAVCQLMAVRLYRLY